MELQGSLLIVGFFAAIWIGGLIWEKLTGQKSPSRQSRDSTSGKYDSPSTDFDGDGD